MSNLADVKRGRAWKFGDSVDTSQLANLLADREGMTEAEALRKNCLRNLRPEFADEVQPGDILVAGVNFGCGSSRQTAVEALQLCGISTVLVESIARIHRRNSIALALPTFVLPGINELVDDGDELEVDYANSAVRNVTQGTEIALPKLPRGVEQILDSGGLLPVIVERLAERGITPQTVAAPV
jgi:3-isopropylmalate/(R)-2-methylmalate dehydratase small subunit